MDIRDINFIFQVFDEDTTSENWLAYRQTIIDALDFYRDAAGPSDRIRIDRMLNDCNRTEPTTYDVNGTPESEPEY